MKNKKLAARILEMSKIEQTLRLNAKPGMGNDNLLIYAIDGVHNHYLQQIIKRYGYPSHELIGAEAMTALWLLVQHQDYDLDLQETCLANCDFAPVDNAHLTDRVRKNKGEMQVYGTQRHRNAEGELELYTIENPETVNDRRKEVGLEPL